MPRPSNTVFTTPVANAAGDCFEVGETIRRVASAIGVQPTSVTAALERGRRPDAPDALRRMSELYDARQAEEARLRLLRDRMRERLARAAGHD